jgi:hypothetical protein
MSSIDDSFGLLSSYTVGHINTILSFDIVGETQAIDWSFIRQIMKDYGVYTDELDQIISEFESGNFSVVYTGLSELKGALSQYPADMSVLEALSDYYGVDYSQEVTDYLESYAPDFDIDLGRLITPLYDFSSLDEWLTTSGVNDLYEDILSGSTTSLAAHIAQSSIDAIYDQAEALVSRTTGGVLDDLFDSVSDAAAVKDIVTNFHTDLLDLFSTSLNTFDSEDFSVEDYEARFNSIVGQFNENAKDYLEEKDLGFFTGLLHLEEVNSFRANFWTPGEKVIGGDKKDNILTNDLDDHVDAGAGDDVIFTQGGNDIIEAGSGNNIISGGEGTDTAVYKSSKALYTINKLADKLTVAGDSANDELVDVERLSFSDAALAFDIDDIAGQAYRIYKAAFDRIPDHGGLGFWIDALDKGALMSDVAYGFTHSEEFISLYGVNNTDEEFINLMYNNVLDRDADQGGYDFWTGHLDNGAITREGILIEFSESAENQANVIDLIANGIEYTEWMG